jgi:hypothetical protein
VSREEAKNGRRKKLDEWFPTLVRYVGMGLLIYSGLVDRGANPALIPAAMAMIVFKTVYGAGPPSDKE